MVDASQREATFADPHVDANQKRRSTRPLIVFFAFEKQLGRRIGEPHRAGAGCTQEKHPHAFAERWKRNEHLRKERLPFVASAL